MSSKTFFITGANSGFGFAIATAAIQAGHKVIGTVRSEASREALAKTSRRSARSFATSPNLTAFQTWFGKQRKSTARLMC
ncbi:NAD(P)-dependent dehydrogenase (short-subunit alcohol dehydrogenase family) [Rhizobium pisi]